MISFNLELHKKIFITIEKIKAISIPSVIPAVVLCNKTPNTPPITPPMNIKKIPNIPKVDKGGPKNGIIIPNR